MADRLEVLRSLQGSFTCSKPIIDSFLDQTGLAVMVGEDLGLRFDDFWKVITECVSNVSMQLPPPAEQQALVGSIPDKCVLEDVARIWRGAASKDQFGFRQSIEWLLKI